MSYCQKLGGMQGLDKVREDTTVGLQNRSRQEVQQRLPKCGC